MVKGRRYSVQIITGLLPILTVNMEEIVLQFLFVIQLLIQKGGAVDVADKAVGEEAAIGTVLHDPGKSQSRKITHIFENPAADRHHAGVTELGLPIVVLKGGEGAVKHLEPFFKIREAFLASFGGLPGIADIRLDRWDRGFRGDAGGIGPGDGTVAQGETVGILDPFHHRSKHIVNITAEPDFGGDTLFGQAFIDLVEEHDQPVAGTLLPAFRHWQK